MKKLTILCSVLLLTISLIGCDKSATKSTVATTTGEVDTVKVTQQKSTSTSKKSITIKNKTADDTVDTYIRVLTAGDKKGFLELFKEHDDDDSAAGSKTSEEIYDSVIKKFKDTKYEDYSIENHGVNSDTNITKFYIKVVATRDQVYMNGLTVCKLDNGTFLIDGIN